jgi:hypothetical protein
MQLKRDIAPRSFQSRIPRYLQIAGVVYCVTIGLAKQVTSAGARGLRLQMQMLLLVEREDTSASRLACMAEAKGGKYVVTHSPIRVTLPWRTQNHWLPFEYASRSRATPPQPQKGFEQDFSQPQNAQPASRTSSLSFSDLDRQMPASTGQIG